MRVWGRCGKCEKRYGKRCGGGIGEGVGTCVGVWGK